MPRPLAEARIAQLEEAIRSKPNYSDGATESMRRLATGRLDEWLGDDDKRELYRALFRTGTSNTLSGKQLSALLDWMALKKSPMGDQYAETDASAAALAEMKAIVAEYKAAVYRVLPGFEHVERRPQ